MKPQRVYTSGSFDLFHAGHVRFLQRCALLGDVTVALNTDEFVARYKGKRPVIPYADRETVLYGCRHVKLVLPQPSESLAEQLEKCRPDYLAVGSDWARKDYYAQIGVDQNWLDAHEIILTYLPYTPHVSSSSIRYRLERAA